MQQRMFIFSLMIGMSFYSNGLTAQSDSATFANQQLSQPIRLNIFPNPSQGTFYITMVNGEAQKAEFLSIDGNLIKTVYLQNGLNYMDLDLESGMYFIRLSEGELKENYKIIIK